MRLVSTTMIVALSTCRLFAFNTPRQIVRRSSSKLLPPRLVDVANSVIRVAETTASFSPPTIVDIGCDHCLLVGHLSFPSNPLLSTPLVAIDSSPSALSGGRDLMDKIKIISEGKNSPVELMCGDGLSPLFHNEISSSNIVLSISGMGVSTMKKILTEGALQRLSAIHNIVLQPTNTKPRNMQLIYDHLTSLKFRPRDERFFYDDRRFYITTTFQKTDNDEPAVLGSFLYDTERTRQIYEKYTKFHEEWSRKIKEKI